MLPNHFKSFRRNFTYFFSSSERYFSTYWFLLHRNFDTPIILFTIFLSNNEKTQKCFSSEGKNYVVLTQQLITQWQRPALFIDSRSRDRSKSSGMLATRNLRVTRSLSFTREENWFLFSVSVLLLSSLLLLTWHVLLCYFVVFFLFYSATDIPEIFKKLNSNRVVRLQLCLWPRENHAEMSFACPRQHNKK